MNFQKVKTGFSKLRTLRDVRAYRSSLRESGMFSFRQLQVIDEMYELRRFEIQHPQIEREINVAGVFKNEGWH